MTHLLCIECEPTEHIETTGESIALPDGRKIVTQEPERVAIPRKFRKVVSTDKYGNAVLDCGHKRTLTAFRFPGESQ